MNRQKGITLVDRIEKYLLMYIILWCTMPFLQLNITPILILMCVFGFIGIKVVCTRTVSVQQIFMLIYIAVAFFYRLFGVSTAAWGNYYMLFITFWFIFPLQYYMEYMPLKEKRIILNYTFVAIFVNGIYNLCLNFWHKGISSEINFTRKFDKYNVWGTDYIQNVVLLVGVWFICYFVCSKRRNILLKLMYFFIFGSMCLYMLVTARTTSILLFGMIVVVFYYFFMKNRKRRLLEIIFLGFMGVIALLFVRELLLLMAQITSFNAHLSNAFMAMANIGVDNFNDQSSMSIRFELYLTSINTFVKNWKNVFMGVGYHSVDNTLDYGVGNHSQIIDDITRYGVIGICVQVMFWGAYILYLKRKITLKIKDKRSVWALYITYVLFVVMSILNNTYKPMTGLIIFFVYPLLVNVKGELENEINQRNIEKNCAF